MMVRIVPIVTERTFHDLKCGPNLYINRLNFYKNKNRKGKIQIELKINLNENEKKKLNGASGRRN